MTPEERSLLERTHKLAEENNEILRSLRRAHRISVGLRIGYWVLIIGLSIGAYYFVQPYVDKVLELYPGDIVSPPFVPGSLQNILEASHNLPR